MSVRFILVLSMLVVACSAPSASTSPSPTATGPSSASPASPSPTPTATPIALPSTAQLSAPSSTALWALVAGTRLFRSSDRGDTWTERALPAGATNVEIAFSNDQDGLLLATGSPATQCQTQAATIWRTADGGGSWQKVVSSGIADQRCKTGIVAGDAAHAVFVATTPPEAVLVYRTANGGQTWTAAPPLPGAPGQSAVFAIAMGRPRIFNTTVLVAAGGGQQSEAVFRSTDGGATFSFASSVPSIDGTVAFVTASRWLQLSPLGSRETTDGGASWHAFATDYSQAAPIAPEVVFGDALVGYATVRGAIQRTTDGGAHWTAIKTPGT